MKTLGKLKIDSKKVIRNEELLKLKGGSMCFYDCTCRGSSNPPYSSGSFSVAITDSQQIIEAVNQHCATGDADCTLSFCL